MTETYLEGRAMYAFFVFEFIMFLVAYFYLTNPSIPKSHPPPYKDYEDFCFNLDFQGSSIDILDKQNECVANCTAYKNCDLQNGGWL